MKKHVFLGLWFIFIFTALVFACGGKDKSKIQAERVVKEKQAENDGTHTNEADIVAGLRETRRHEVYASDSEVEQFVSPAWHKELACAFYLVFK